MNAIESFITHSTKYALTGTVICGAAALEMAVRTIHDLGKLGSNRGTEDLSKDLAGALFYGLCAANIVPYTAVAGAAIFSLYSFCVYDKRDAYVTAQAIGNCMAKIGDHILTPIWNHIIAPLAGKIAAVFASIFSVIQLPENPAWYGVAALVVAIVAYKGLPILNPLALLR